METSRTPDGCALEDLNNSRGEYAQEADLEKR